MVIFMCLLLLQKQRKGVQEIRVWGVQILLCSLCSVCTGLYFSILDSLYIVICGWDQKVSQSRNTGNYLISFHTLSLANEYVCLKLIVNNFTQIEVKFVVSGNHILYCSSNFKNHNSVHFIVQLLLHLPLKVNACWVSENLVSFFFLIPARWQMI